MNQMFVFNSSGDLEIPMTSSDRLYNDVLVYVYFTLKSQGFRWALYFLIKLLFGIYGYDPKCEIPLFVIVQKEYFIDIDILRL